MLNVYQESLNAFRLKMLEELRSVRNSPPPQTQDNTMVKFGTLPPTQGGSPVLGSGEGSAASTQAHDTTASTTTTGSFATLTPSKDKAPLPLNLNGNISETVSHPFGVSQPVNATVSGSASLNTASINEKGQSSTATHGHNVVNQHQGAQNQYFQHFGQHPFNYMLGPGPSQSQPQVFVSSNDNDIFQQQYSNLAHIFKPHLCYHYNCQPSLCVWR
ncbi:hypothetical protein ACLB2K_041133 [Fragaria x ananassa]